MSPATETGVVSFHRRVQRLFEAAWPSYLLVAALQTKVLWEIWRYRDLTTGDTSAYFVRAYGWSQHLTVDILWSPLYTAFYGSVFALTHDTVTATLVHRMLIVMLATVGVLGVMRVLLPPALALAVATWWAVLPINFNTLYEVHLFALLPVLAIFLIVAHVPSPFGRGLGVAMFLVTAVLVRNELLIAGALFAAACFALEVIDVRRQTMVRVDVVRKRLVAYLVPVMIALLVCVFFYSRSTVRGADLQPRARAKHTVNMCQVYAFGYAQRHPEWAASPWIDCYGLAETTFGERTPSLGQMIAANPRATFEHMSWNLALVPAGLQLALFDRTWGGPNPDYAPVEHPNSTLATLLAIAACLTVVAGVWLLARNARSWWDDWFRSRCVVWLAMLSVACVSVPVILTQRPRPSYLFALTVVLMAVIGSAVHVITHRSPRLRDYFGMSVYLMAVLCVPPYFAEHPSSRPLAAVYEVLRPLGPTLARTKGRLVIGDYAGELQSYVGLSRTKTFENYGVLAERSADQTVGDFVDQRGISAIFIQPRIKSEFERLPGAEAFVAHPESFGWRKQSTTTNGLTWVLLYRPT